MIPILKLGKNKSQQKRFCRHERVPRGGVLSPTLVLVYINYILTNISKRVSNTLYADDLVI